MLLSWLALANCIISHFLFADNENFIFFFYDYFPTCSIIFFANCWNRSAVSLSIGASCPICPATIAATSSMESGFCFCSASASCMAWNIAAVTASPGCSPLSMSFLISHIFSIYRDKKDRMWIGTFGGGLDLAEPTADGKYKFRHFFKQKYGLKTVSYTN